jgi:hypothetical protein
VFWKPWSYVSFCLSFFGGGHYLRVN